MNTEHVRAVAGDAIFRAMKPRSWLAGAVLAGGVVFAMRGCLTQRHEAPDEQLAGRLIAMCKIARANVSSPEPGVRALGRYLDRHVGDLLGEWGATLAAIERIPDDWHHDERARLARDRLRKPLLACERDWARFGDAVQRDPAATALVERFNMRLSRTFEIIFSNGQFDLRRLLDQLEHAFELR